MDALALGEPMLVCLAAGRVAFIRAVLPDDVLGILGVGREPVGLLGILIIFLCNDTEIVMHKLELRHVHQSKNV